MVALDNPLDVFFDLVPTGAALYAPLYDAGGELVDFRFARLNPAGQRLLGLPAQPPRTFREYYPSSVPTGIFAQYRTAYLTGQAVTYDVPYEGDGLDTYFRLVAQRSGELLVVNFTDMADLPHSAVEQSLRESRAREQVARTEAEAQRQRFYELLLQLPASMATYHGPAHVYELVNPRYQQLFRSRHLLGLPIREALPELHGQPILAQLDQVYATGAAHYELEQAVWVDVTDSGQPEQRYYNVLLQPLRNAHGDVEGLLNFTYDVTEQVRARQQVEHLNQKLEARVQERTQQLRVQQGLLAGILRQVPATISTLSGPDHRYSFFNDAYHALARGRPRLGVPIAEVLPELVAQGFIGLLDQVYATGEPFIGRELPAHLVDAATGQVESRYLDFVYQPLADEQRQTQGILAFSIDVTDKVVARQQVQDLNEKLAALNEELTASNEALSASNAQLTRTNVDLDTFVYTASHDLKAPITNIESIVLALRDTLPAAVQQDELVAHLLDLLNQTVARFQFTIGQLTDISRLQLAHVGAAEPVILATVVEAVRLDLAPAIAAAGAQLTVEVAPELIVSFSPANLRSIVYNLLSNAIKYRDPERPSQVRIRAEQTPHATQLTVQDNGLGMSEVQQRQLFGLFQRLHTHVEGTGVGLYITKRLVENAGGTITVQSQPNVGTTFTVTLPA